MRIWSYNKERKEKGFVDIYIMAIMFGCFAAILLIGGGIGLKFTIKFLIENWAWALGSIFAAILLRKFYLIKTRNSSNG